MVLRRSNKDGVMGQRPSIQTIDSQSDHSRFENSPIELPRGIGVLKLEFRGTKLQVTDPERDRLGGYSHVNHDQCVDLKAKIAASEVCSFTPLELSEDQVFARRDDGQGLLGIGRGSSVGQWPAAFGEDPSIHRHERPGAHHEGEGNQDDTDTAPLARGFHDTRSCLWQSDAKLFERDGSSPRFEKKETMAVRLCTAGGHGLEGDPSIAIQALSSIQSNVEPSRAG